MLRKYLLGTLAFVLAFGILSVSVLRSASVSFGSVNPSPTPATTEPGATPMPEINYQISYPGNILPDSPFWFIKALRDKIWYTLTTDHLKKAELALLFSDKRLVSAESLFKNQKPDMGLSTLTKGEKYLEIAVNQEMEAEKEGEDTSVFLNKIATSALKHRQIIEETITPTSPEDLRPEINKAGDYSKNTYKSSRDMLNSKGLPTPINPFDGQ